MDGLGSVETNAEVLAVAQAAGFEPSEKRRKDWRRAGLLPHPLKQSGKGRTSGGSVALYPAGTGALLAAICRRSVRKTPLRDVAVLVWWDGYRPADAGPLRSLLRDALDGWERETAPWKDLGAVPPEHWADVDRRAGGRRLGALEAVRDRAGGTFPFSELVAALHHVAAGGFEGFRACPGARVEESKNAARDGIGLDGVVWFSGGIEATFRDVAATLRIETLRRVLQDATDADLDAARDECRILDGLLRDTGAIAARLGVVALRPFAVLDGYTPPPCYLCLFVVWWLSLRRFAAFRKRFDELRTAAAIAGALRRELDVAGVKIPPRRSANRPGARQEGSDPDRAEAG